MRQIRMPMNLYRTPCSPAYWHEANLAMKCLKLLVFAALMIAVTRALSLIPGIPIWHTKLTWASWPGRYALWCADRCWGWSLALWRIFWALSSSPPGTFSPATPCPPWRECWNRYTYSSAGGSPW